MATHSLDLTGLLCPLPVIKVQNHVAGLIEKDVVIAICSDRGAAEDIPTWCRLYGHQVLSIEKSDDGVTITLQVGSTNP